MMREARPAHIKPPYMTSISRPENARECRVLIVQPSVPEYRLPFFEQFPHKSGISLRVVAGEDGLTARELRGGVRSTRFSYVACPTRTFFGGRLVWQSGLQLDEWLRKGDVLVISGNPRILSNYPLVWQARRKGVGVVWWGHGWTTGSRGISAWLRRQIMKIADVTLLYTDAEVDSYVALGFDRKTTFATNNALDQTLAFRYTMEWDATRLAEFKNQNGIEGRRILLFVGRLTPKADVGFLIRALTNLKTQWPDVLLVVIGDGRELAKLKSFAAELGVEGYVKWLGSIYDEESLAPWFLSADIFVYPGAIGLSLLHAMGYGLPVLTHSDPAHHMPEFAAVRDGYNSVTFARCDMRSFVEKVSQVLSAPSFRQSLSRNARETVAATYSMEQMVERFAQALRTASEIAASKAIGADCCKA